MYYVNLDEIMQERGIRRSYQLLGEEHGCVNGCKCGVTIYDETEYGKGGVHEDQEGFIVLSGHGMAMVKDEEFPIKEGTCFIAPAGCYHVAKRNPDSEPLKIFWFHSAI